ETPSPMNAFGAKGMGDGSSMLTPAAIANAVADALGREDIALPLTRQRVWALANNVRPTRRAARRETDRLPEGGLRGEGEVIISAPPAEVWRLLTDPVELSAIVPGCERLQQAGPDRYTAEVTISVAAVRGSCAAEIELKDQKPPESMRLV